MNTLSTGLQARALRLLALSGALIVVLAAQAQRTKYWVGGSGVWGDAAHWALTPGGPGGAGVPRNSEQVVIAPVNAIDVRIDQDAYAGGLTIDGSRAAVTIGGAHELRVSGDLRTNGAVHWRPTGPLLFDLRGGLAELDLRGIPLGGDASFSGGGTWSIKSDLVLADDHRLDLKEGTLVTNGNLLRTGTLSLEGRRTKKLIANTSVVMVEHTFLPGDARGVVDPGTSRLVVNGAAVEWGGAAELPADAMRAINICGTGAGQMLFTINAQLVSNHNGFGVTCHGVCDGTVNVSVTGGVGPFFYTWIGGPSGTGAATWNNVCPGNQIVIVTDQGQGISCATTVQVTDPALLSVIFFGNQPPTCAEVCNGVSNAFAVGGVPTYNYVWNNGAGTGESFNQLCPGTNTLHVTDANGCAFDTTFDFPVLPITPNLTSSNASCSGECNGAASVAPTGGTGSYTYDWQPGTPVGDGTNSVSQLCAGSYQVTITDVNGCDTTVQFTITEPPAIIPNASQTDATCSNVCDGTAMVAPSGAAGPFTFNWAPAPGGGQGTPTATGLCAGVYTCTIQDVPTGCDTLVTFTITAPPPIDPHGTSTDALCAGSCDGTATVAPTGGTPGYTYLWTPGPPAGQGTPGATGLCAGVWTVLISDNVGCDTLVTFTIAEPLPIAPDPSQTDVTCAGLCDGTATVAPTGGTGTYTYLWTPVPPVGQGTSSASQLCAGPWSVLISDANGCDTTVEFTITEPAPLQATASQTNVTCGGNCDGTAAVVVTGGTGGYTYAWTPAPGGGQGTATATGLCAGPASVLITDDNGCTLTHDFTILPAVPMQLSLNIAPASCPGVCDGTAGIIVTGGVPGYTYTWSPAPGAGQGTPNVTGLCPQAYDLTVTDAVGCDTTISFTITAPAPILPNEVVTDATCAGSCNGSIVLAPTGGSGTFIYVWSPVPPNGQGTAQATGLCAGTYDVTVTSGSCDTTLTVTIAEPLPIDPALTVTPVVCAGECNGTATSATTGGMPGYTYVWSPAPGAGQSTPNATGLCAGNYTLTITDLAGCDSIVPFTITEPGPIVPDLTFTDADCGLACNGEAAVAPTGGTGTYTFLWSPEPGSGQGTNAVTGLCPGTWNVTIADAAGCDTTVEFTIATPPPIVVTPVVTPATCPSTCDGTIVLAPTGGLPPYTYTWSPEPGTGQGTPNVGGLCPGDRTVTIGDQAGCDTTLTITITSPSPILPNETVTDATCAGSCNGSIVLAPTGGSGTFTYVWSPVPPNGQGTAQATGLCAGTYDVTVTSGACDTTLSITITEPPPIDPALTVTPVVCAGECNGTATSATTGGVPGYIYLWSPAPGAGQGTPNATGLCAGNYTLTITDLAGCDSIVPFTITEPGPIAPDLTFTDADCGLACNGTAAVAPIGGTGTYSFLWSPEPGSGQGTNAVAGLCPGTWNVTIADAAGCDTTVEFTIATPPPIVVAPVVTPATCANTCDGTITLAPTGGLPPYTYTWSPEPGTGQGTPNVGGLCPGDRTVIIGDQAGCDTTLTITITSPPPILPNGTFTDESCNGPCDGTASVAPTGGDGTFSFFWSPAPGAGQGTPSASGLCAGDWSVTITDGSGCDTTWSFTVSPVVPVDASVTVQDILCAGVCSGEATVTASGGVGGYTYDWQPSPPVGQGTDHVSGLCAGTYQVTVADAAGCDTTIELIISAPAPLDPELVVENEACTGPCTGTATVSVTGGTGTYGYDWQPAPGGGQGTPTATGLCAGVSYEVTVTDANGCDTTLAFTVDPFDPIVPDVSVTPAGCATSCDGEAAVSVSGGEGPYTLSWSPVPPNGQGVTTAIGLCAGTYDLTVTDANGCDTTVQVVITAPAPFDVAATLQHASCFGECNGDIALTTAGGTAGYTYAWSPVPASGQGTDHVSGLCAGDWTVTIGDANGCDTTITYTITEPAPLAATADVTSSHCHVCDGGITLHATGGTAPYTFAWGPPLNVTTSDSTQTALCAGLYPILITDASGCTLARSVAVSDSDGEALTVTDGATTCPNTCDGEVSVAFTCTIAPCTIAWYDLAGNDLSQSGNTLSGLCAGGYLVQVTNGDGCLSIDTATVVAPDGLEGAISSTPVSCADACDGTATIGLSGGTGPFIITWVPAPGGGQGTPHATGLCPGVYDIQVDDLGGCDPTFSVLITAPDALSVGAVVADISCNGQCDGSITLDVQGGSGAFTYIWDPVPPSGQGAAAATGLCAGDYDVVVSDANGCDTTMTFTIAEPAALTLTPTTTLSHCVVCDGSITLAVAGGTGIVDVNWTDASGNAVGTGTSISGLCAGLYTADAVDANGCSASVSVAITDATGEALVMTDGQTLCANACDAQVEVTFTCSTAPCTITWYDEAANILAQDQSVVDGLCTGLYVVQVTNGAGCSTIDTAFVTPSQTIIPNLSSTPVSCADACDGTATVGPAGGVDPYTFTWTPEPGGGQGTPQATGLCPGVYEVLIEDASGCDTLVSVLIGAPSPIQVDAQLEGLRCNGACDGSIVLTPSGGNGFFAFAWSPVPPNGQGGNGAFDLCAGDWTVTITDINGCDTTITYTIAEPPPLDLAIASTPSDCNLCTGTASVQASGGTTPYLYSWTLGAPVFSTDSAIADLCAGLYTITVTDANDCTAQLQVPISDVDGEVVTTTGDLLACPGQCDGEVTAAFVCGVPACTVAWYDGLGNDLNEPSTTLSDLCAGIYFVQVTNGAGCITIDSAVVAEPDPIIANLSSTPVSCPGTCDGTATVGPTGGSGTYTYLWAPEPGGGQGTPAATGLCAGTYQVTITDDAGCSVVQDVLIGAPDPIDATAVIGRITCNSACDGSITVTPTGGNGGFTFLWSPEPGSGQGTNTVTGLCAGDWDVTITDAGGCDTTFTVTLTDPPVLTVDLATTDNACNGDCTATAGATISGGEGPYTITWTDAAGDIIGQDVPSIADLCAGDYTLTVEDANGCEQSHPFTIAQGAAIEAGLVVRGESCNGPCDGTATVSPSGGTGSGYTVLWQPEPGAGQGTNTATGLCAGDWSVTITDDGGCDTTYQFTIEPYEHMDMNGVILPPTCNGACDGSIDLTVQNGLGGYTFLWSPEPGTGQGTNAVTGLCAGDQTVTITDAGGCDTTIVITLPDPPAIVISVDAVTDASCSSATDGSIAVTITGGVPGYTIEWSGPGGFSSGDEDIAGLGPGDYTLLVTDDNGCQTGLPVTVGALGTVTADAGDDATVCAGDGITLDGSDSQGGTSYAWRDEQGDLLGTDVVVVIPGLPPGEHTFTLTVSDGPCADSDQVTITILASPAADAGPDQVLFVQGTVTLGGQPSGPPGSTFAWTPDTLVDVPDGPNPTATVNTTTWFVLTVTSPDGCVDVDSVLITILPEVEVPSGFTPNGDGYNDTWQIDFIDLFPLCEVEIYNRWGEPLFKSVGYNVPWDGRYNGGLVPVGTYYYAIKLNDPRFPDALTGPLTVIR